VVSGQLEDSLRHEIESYIEGRIGGIKQEIAALQSQLNESLTRLMDRQSEVQLDGGVADSILEHLRAAHDEGIDLAASESSRAKASSDMAIVKAAISEIEEQQSQADILKILVNRASSFAPRVAFFVVKGDQSVGWRARGFQGTVGDTVVHQLSFSSFADTAVGSAIRSRETWSGGPGSHSENHLILNRFGDDPPARIVTVPLVVRQRTVAVLYADSDGLDSEAINLEALETLVRVAGMAVDLLAARSAPAIQPAQAEPRVEETPVEEVPAEAAPQVEAAPVEAAPVEAAPVEAAPVEAAPVEAAPAQWEERQPEQHTYTPVAEYDEIAPVVEESAPVSDVHEFQEMAPQQVEYAMPEQVEAATEHLEFAPEPEQIQPVPEQVQFAPPAEAAEPPITQFEAPVDSIPTLPEPEIVAAPTARRRYGIEVELPVDVATEDERRLHNDARRFARLLVSEIKLYNEQKVTEGRTQNDLYFRLRDYIDRSREMYDKRVKPEVATRYDYFHQELVNTLAEGDPAKMGSGYPGATVSG
jgi:hypothetical protein